MNLKPGDLFEWVYKDDNSSVAEDEELYSYIMGKWVLCSGLCFCVGGNHNVIHWVSNNGLFCGPREPSEAGRLQSRRAGYAIIPRKVES